MLQLSVKLKYIVILAIISQILLYFIMIYEVKIILLFLFIL